MKTVLLKPQLLLSTLFFLVFSIGLSACSNTEKAKPEYKTIQTLNEQQVETGTVIAVNKVIIQPSSYNYRPNIGIAASSGGFRSIYGSVDLATLSRLFTNSGGAKTAQEIIIKKNNGQTVAITETTKDSFKAGDVVKILKQDGIARVIR